MAASGQCTCSFIKEWVFPSSSAMRVLIRYYRALLQVSTDICWMFVASPVGLRKDPREMLVLCWRSSLMHVSIMRSTLGHSLYSCTRLPYNIWHSSHPC